jgi:putative protein-disulfide isomerase
VTRPVLLYGFDPLCGWCYGMAPAMRAVSAAHAGLEIRVVMAGLVTGDRVGPYALKTDYIRQASSRLHAVTGRRPSSAFFDLISRPGVTGDSTPPAAAIAQVARLAPHRAVDFAHAVIEAHFADGADLGDPATYPPLLAAAAPEVADVDIADRASAEAAFAEGRAIGIAAFPTLLIADAAGLHALPTEYRPDRLETLVAARLGVADQPLETPSGSG